VFESIDADEYPAARVPDEYLVFPDSFRVLKRFHFFPPFFMATTAGELCLSQFWRPVKDFNSKRVSARVFIRCESNTGQPITNHSVSLDRIYNDGDELRDVSKFARDDIPVARLLLNRAWEFILDAESASGTDADEAK